MSADMAYRLGLKQTREGHPLKPGEFLCAWCAVESDRTPLKHIEVYLRPYDVLGSTPKSPLSGTKTARFSRRVVKASILRYCGGR